MYLNQTTLQLCILEEKNHNTNSGKILAKNHMILNRTRILPFKGSNSLFILFTIQFTIHVIFKISPIFPSPRITDFSQFFLIPASNSNICERAPMEPPCLHPPALRGVLDDEVVEGAEAGRDFIPCRDLLCELGRGGGGQRWGGGVVL